MKKVVEKLELIIPLLSLPSSRTFSLPLLSRDLISNLMIIVQLHTQMCARARARARVCVCVCVCVREREREREIYN